jgi:hypothetical protein
MRRYIDDMKISSLAQHGFLVGAGVLVLAGCSGSSVPSVAPSHAGPAAGDASVRADRQRTWMAPDAKKQQLLYVSDAEADDVNVYSYPAGKLKGQLTGFDGVQGLCSDKAGDVWIANSNQEAMLEYKHGGTTPIATLNDPGYLPVDCSVDPTTGNLAVANSEGYPSHGPGDLAIYTGAKGSPQLYGDSSLYFTLYVGYDNAGDAFVDAQAPGSGAFAFAELPKGGSTLGTVTTTGISGLGAGVAWDGKYITVGIGRPSSTIYQLQVSGSAATIAGTTTISGNPGLGKYVVVTKGRKQGNTVIDPEVGGTKDVGFFKYPSGTGPVKAITGLQNPVAVAISK